MAEPGRQWLPSIEVIRDGWILPGTRRKKDAGVFHKEGNIVDSALHWRRDVWNEPVFHIDANAEIERAESGIFAGFLFTPHFGHTLMESLGRLWALRYLSIDVGSLYFLPGETYKPTTLPKYFTDLLDLLQVRRKIIVVKQPTSIARLLVPQQLFGFGERLKADHEFVEFLRSIPGLVNIKIDPDLRIYVSRSALARFTGNLLGESWLDENFERQGYQVIHPERLSLQEQVDIYLRAGTLIFAEGSAFHLFALLARIGQRVGIVFRRKGGEVQNYINQMKWFGGVSADSFPCVQGYYYPNKHPHPKPNALSAIDIAKLGDLLAEKGYIDKQIQWQCPSEADLHAELDQYLSSHPNGFTWSLS